MKRNIYSFLMAAALCGAVSCSDKISTETPQGAGYITVTSQVGSQTKAGYETKTLPADFVMEVNQGAAAEYDYYVLMQKDGASNIYNESTGKTLAWASTDHSKVQVKAMTIPTGTSFDANKVLNISIEKDQTTNENFFKNDILGASTNNGVSIVKDNIVVSFRHLMSKLHVIYDVADGSMVEAIQLKNVAIQGAYSFADMDYVSNDNPGKGDITMFLNAGTQYGLFAAEAIFCPYTPTTASKPALAVKIKNINDPVSCDISLPANFSFEGGKRYVMKITISENGTVQTASISAENDWVKNVPGGKILWVGTSIPAGGGTVYSYPQMVANATGLNVINNAVGGSVLLKPLPAYSFDVATWNYLYAGGLSQTHEEAESTIRPKLVAAANDYKDPSKTEEELKEIRNTWVTEQLNVVKSLSYESLIIPYINGALDNCETIIIDHGFNDFPRMALEAGAFMAWNSTPTSPEGYSYYAEGYFDAWLNDGTLADGIKPTYEHYKLHLQNTQWDNTSGNAVLFKEDSYLLAMESIINECRKVNPNINIIIGNYFAEHTTWLNFAHYQGGLTEYRLTHVLLDYNRVAAKIFNCLDIVNVYDYLEITNDELWSGSGTYQDTVNLLGFNADVDFSKFCPDGVHPSSDATGKSNKAIADVYLKELKRIFSSNTTKSSSNSYDYGWEDVEIL